jgi:hypothetical protein
MDAFSFYICHIIKHIIYGKCINEKNNAKKQLVELESELAKLGYKVDAITQKLVKI